MNILVADGRRYWAGIDHASGGDMSCAVVIDTSTNTVVYRERCEPPELPKVSEVVESLPERKTKNWQKTKFWE